MSDQKLTAQLNNIISPMLFAQPDARNLDAIRMLLRHSIDQTLDRIAAEHSIPWSDSTVALPDMTHRFLSDALNETLIDNNVPEANVPVATINAIRVALEAWIEDALEDVRTSDAIERDGVHLRMSRNEVTVTVKSEAGGGGELTLHPDEWAKFAAAVAEVSN